MVVLIVLGNTQSVQAAVTLAEPGPVCSSKRCSHPALLPDVGHVGSVLDTIPVHTPNHPEALTHLWLQKAHTCFCHPRHGPGPKLPSQSSQSIASLWQVCASPPAGYGSLDRHSQGRVNFRWAMWGTESEQQCTLCPELLLNPQTQWAE